MKEMNAMRWRLAYSIIATAITIAGAVGIAGIAIHNTHVAVQEVRR